MLIVEDGSLVAGATSYATLESADEYLSLRGLWPVSAIDEQEEALRKRVLVRAFDWLNTLEWLGEKLDWQQEAAWPRRNVPVPGKDGEFIASNMVPGAVVRAQFEVAALIYNGLDMFRPLERGGKVVSESHSKSEGSLDVIGGDSKSHSYTYSEAAPVETFYPAVAGLIGPYLAIVPGKADSGRVLQAGRG